MSELIEGSAVNLGNLTKEQSEAVDHYHALSPEERAKVDAEVIAMQAKSAEGMLKSAKGWDIARQLYADTMRKILATSEFTLPTLANKDAILAKLSDPTGFQKSFQTLVADLDLVTRVVQNLGNKHKHKTGQPTEAEMPELFEITSEYNEVLTKFEATIDPLLTSLIDVVIKEYASDQSSTAENSNE